MQELVGKVAATLHHPIRPHNFLGFMRNETDFSVWNTRTDISGRIMNNKLLGFFLDTAENGPFVAPSKRRTCRVGSA